MTIGLVEGVQSGVEIKASGFKFHNSVVGVRGF